MSLGYRMTKRGKSQLSVLPIRKQKSLRIRLALWIQGLQPCTQKEQGLNTGLILFCVCDYAHMYVCGVYAHVCRVPRRCHLTYSITLHGLSQYLKLSWWPASPSDDPPVSAPNIHWSSVCVAMAGFLCGCERFECRSSDVRGKHSYPLMITPAPENRTFF